MTWIPITGCFPEPHTRVLVTHTPMSDHKEVCIAEWFSWTNNGSHNKMIVWHQDSEYVDVDGYDACINHTELCVTHWMPLINPA